MKFHNIDRDLKRLDETLFVSNQANYLGAIAENVGEPKTNKRLPYRVPCVIGGSLCLIWVMIPAATAFRVGTNGLGSSTRTSVAFGRTKGGIHAH